MLFRLLLEGVDLGDKYFYLVFDRCHSQLLKFKLFAIRFHLLEVALNRVKMVQVLDQRSHDWDSCRELFKLSA